MFFGAPGGEEDPRRIASDFRQRKSATLQWSRSDRNPCPAFSGSALCHHFGTLGPWSTKLLPGWRRSPAIVPARCPMGQRLSAFSGPEIGNRLESFMCFPGGTCRARYGRPVTFCQPPSTGLDAARCGVVPCQARTSLAAWRHRWGNEQPRLVPSRLS